MIRYFTKTFSQARPEKEVDEWLNSFILPTVPAAELHVKVVGYQTTLHALVITLEVDALREHIYDKLLGTKQKTVGTSSTVSPKGELRRPPGRGKNRNK